MWLCPADLPGYDYRATPPEFLGLRGLVTLSPQWAKLPIGPVVSFTLSFLSRAAEVKFELDVNPKARWRRSGKMVMKPLHMQNVSISCAKVYLRNNSSF
jgi:hypothetical protein